jgi:predicted house-cleaning noncanonical NTP pyrophosphatase (MazG superfamily)
MKYFQLNKLIRDKILDNMKKDGQAPQGVTKLNKKQFISELIKKLAEETHEFKLAKDKESVADEISDVEEILYYLKKELIITNPYIKKLRKQKKDKAGAFDKKIFITSVGIPENNKWYKYYLDNPDKYPQVKSVSTKGRMRKEKI